MKQIFAVLFFLPGLASAMTCPEAASRVDVITGATGEAFDLQVEVAGKTWQLPATVKTEYERRRSFRLPLQVENYRFDFMETLRDPRQVAVSLLDAGIGIIAGSQEILWLAPLASRNVVGPHGSRGVKVDPTSFQTTAFTIESPSLYTTYPGNNPTKAIYIVGVQKEHSTYFDTTDFELDKKGIAARLKIWTPHSQAPASGGPRSVFLKKDLEQNTLFTTRREYQVVLPQEFPVGAEALVLAPLLARENALPAKPIGAQGTIDNTRFSLDLVVGPKPDQGRKVGFLTIDQFTGTLTGREPIRALQIETELLPEELPLLRTNGHAFGEFFKRIEEHLQTEKTPTPPKFRQTIQMSK